MMMMSNQNSNFLPAGAGGMIGSGNDPLNASNNSQNSAGNPNVNGNPNPNANSVSSFLRSPGNAPAMPGMMANMGAGGGGVNSPNMSGMGGMLAAAQQQQNPMMNMNMNNFNFEQIKRLQQMAQLQQQANNAGGNPLLMSQMAQQQDPSTALLQTYLDQKIQTSRFGELGGAMGSVPGMGALQGMQGGLQGQNPMLQQLMMNQGNMGGGGNVNAALAAGNPGVGEAALPSPHSLFHRDGSRRMRGGVIEPFPEKLHRLLLEVEAAGRGDVISFVAGGRAFAIHKPEKFFKEIVPLYFRQSRLSSFKRQLNLYGFELINTGPARGGYYHELFVKDRPELCRRMRRVAVKVTPKGVSDASDASKEPADKAEKEESKEEASPPTEKAAKQEDTTEETEGVSEVAAPEVAA